MTIENIPMPESVESKVAKLKARKSALSKQDPLDFYEDSTRHAQNLEKKYQEQNRDARKYKAFHVLINSTVESDATHPFYDFPEKEFSIEEFITKKEEEYKIK